MSFTLRALTPADAPAAAALHAAAYANPWSAGILASRFASPHDVGLGWFEAGEMVAFVLSGLVLDEADIFIVATHPARQNQGIARSLLAALIDTLKARGIRRLMLDVAEDNLPAIAVYQRLGFTLDGRRKGYYAAGRAQPVDALLMSCSLTL